MCSKLLEMGAKKGNKNALGNDGGRPTKFKPEFVDQVYKLCLLGATDKELADFFQVEESTINNWKHAHVEFLESLRAGKELADMEIANSLYNRAKGMKITTERAIKVKAGEGVEKVEVVEVIEEIPPDQRSIEYWLNNRSRGKWSTKQEVTGANGGAIAIEVIYTTEENGSNY